MKPSRDAHGTLVDLLDRILEKGVILDADLIVHVSGIPLLGVKLVAALAGMETMLRYGIWEEWDEAQRATATEERRLNKKEVPLGSGEKVMLRMSASLWCSGGVSSSWRPGHLYVTDRRVFLFRKEPAEVLFQCPYEAIRGLWGARGGGTAGGQAEYVHLLLRSGDTAQLHAANAKAVMDAVRDRMHALGLELEKDPSGVDRVAMKSLPG